MASAVPALLTAQDCRGQVHLIIGAGSLAASRCTRSLEVGARPVLISPDTDLHHTLATRIDEDKVIWVRREFEDQDLTTLGREEVDHIADTVFITHGPRNPLSTHVSKLCRRLRIPVNVVDAPHLCSFTLLSTHSDGPLQIGITTSGRGCKLSSRIRREIAASLPSKFGDAVERLGTMRWKIWEEDNVQVPAEPEVEDEDGANQKHTFNTLIPPSSPDPSIARTRRMRWLSQICEYWPLSRLASITDEDVDAILAAYKDSSPGPVSGYILSRRKERGTITLAGSGPGHPDLLTRATYTAIQRADYILADKLVPAGVLDLIPRHTPLHIARKFPGNADAAQEELLQLGLAALQDGKRVLRLKQGDPYLYGRGAEELSFFRQHGFETKVLPGVTSALSAPLFARIPVTHRAVGDQVLICTGTGRKGAAPNPPSYNETQTVIFLMALHRLDSLVASLTLSADGRIPWPPTTPCAVVERASCPDQRVIRTTLEHVCQAVEVEGSRPPGLLVMGACCEVLEKTTDDTQWTVEEGFRELDNDLDDVMKGLTPDGDKREVTVPENTPS